MPPVWPSLPTSHEGYHCLVIAGDHAVHSLVHSVLSTMHDVGILYGYFGASFSGISSVSTGDPRETHGRPTEAPWRPTGDPWDTHGSPMEKPWATSFKAHGRPMGDPCVSTRNRWVTHGRSIGGSWARSIRVPWVTYEPVICTMGDPGVHGDPWVTNKRPMGHHNEPWATRGRLRG